MSAVAVDGYRGHEMETDDEVKVTLPPTLKLDDSSTRQSNSEIKRKRTSRTYQFSERDIRRYHQARKEGRLRFPDLFMYHIQRPTEDVQREARMMRKVVEQQEAERKFLEDRLKGEEQIPELDSAPSDAKLAVAGSSIAVSSNNHPTNFGGLEQHSSNICDESVALKSDLELAGKASSTNQDQVSVVLQDQPAQNMIKRRQMRFGKLTVDAHAGKETAKRLIPVAMIAAAGFAGVVIATSSVGIGVAVAIPCAAIAYGSIKLYEHCKKRRSEKKRRSVVGLKNIASQ